MAIRSGDAIRAMVFSETGIYAENDQILLRRIRPGDKENYINIYRAKGIWKRIFDNLELNAEEGLWNDFNTPNTLNTIIIRKADGAFCGFCGLQGFTELEEPELSIELVEEYQRCGIGAMALPLLMDRFSEITGASAFISKVSSGNAASQKLMRKLGGQPFGIAPFPGLSGTILDMMEADESADVPNGAQLAEEFGTTPRKLRSHVLVYRFVKDDPGNCKGDKYGKL